MILGVDSTVVWATSHYRGLQVLLVCHDIIRSHLTCTSGREKKSPPNSQRSQGLPAWLRTPFPSAYNLGFRLRGSRFARTGGFRNTVAKKRAVAWRVITSKAPRNWNLNLLFRRYTGEPAKTLPMVAVYCQVQVKVVQSVSSARSKLDRICLDAITNVSICVQMYRLYVYKCIQ